MSTRDFDAAYIHSQVLKAQAGVDIVIENTWLKRCKDRYNGFYLTWVTEDNKSLFRRLGLRKMIPVMTLEEYIKDQREERDPWGFDDYVSHKNGYKTAKSTLEKLRILSEENAKASRMMTMDADEYRMVSNYASWVEE